MKQKTLGEVARNTFLHATGPTTSDDWETAAAAVIAEHERRKWRGIETAPKDLPLWGRGAYTFKPLNGELEDVYQYQMTWSERWGQWLDVNGNALSPTHWQYAPDRPNL